MKQSAEEESLRSENLYKEVKSRQPLQSENHESRKPLQSEMNRQDESRQLISSEAKNQSGKVESSENFAHSPLLQILYNFAVGGNPN
jgi:hypothetical protein